MTSTNTERTCQSCPVSASIQPTVSVRPVYEKPAEILTVPFDSAWTYLSLEEADYLERLRKST